MTLAIKIPKAFHKVLIDCAVKSKAQFAMNGINVEFHAGRVILTSSDTHRLFCYSPANDLDTAKAIAEYTAAFKAEQKAKDEKKLAAQWSASGLSNAEDMAKHAKHFADVMKSIDDKPTSFILSIPAFTARVQKLSKNDFLLSLDAIRPEEIIEGQFPRYREVIPSGIDAVPFIQFLAKTEYRGVVFLQPISITIDYLLQAAPVMEYMVQSELLAVNANSPLFAGVGVAPWKEVSESFYACIVIMPIHQSY